jgi:hypothetical protein
MSQLTDLLAQTGGIQSMANELGISESQASAGATALLPAILGGFKKTTQAEPTGLGGLGNILNSLGGGGLLDDVLASHPTNVDRGNNVLGKIFGSKDVSRQVAQNASLKTGLDPSLLKKMLPMLAMMAAGYMAQQRNTSPGQPGTSAPRGGLGSLLDSDGDGNALDDILRLGQRFIR